MEPVYKYIVVGGGPTGISFCQNIKSKGKVLLLEAGSSLGGDHSVRRIYDKFSEHSPRVYLDNYNNFKKMISDAKIPFDDHFVSYNFGASTIANETLFQVFGIREYLVFAYFFSRLTYQSNFGERVSVKETVDYHNFSDKSKDTLDRFCRLIDGVGSDLFPLGSLLQIMNQNALYKAFQPKISNDQGLFCKLENYLVYNKKIDIVKHSKVFKISKEKGLFKVLCMTGEIYLSKNVVLAMPPDKLIKNIDIESKWINETLKEESKISRYDEYKSLTFHWGDKLNLKKVYGFPRSKYGLAFVVTSDYTDTRDNSKTVISCVLTKFHLFPDKNDIESIKKIAFDELKISFGDLPGYSHCIISRDPVDGRAYMKTYKSVKLPQEIPDVPGLFSIGTHNWNSGYAATSIETAVTNGMALASKLNGDLIPFNTNHNSSKITDWISSMVNLLVFVLLNWVFYLVLRSKKYLT
jgi:hypothetical protein